MSHPFEHDAVQLQCDMAVDSHPGMLDDDDEWGDWLRHVEG